MPVKSKVNNNNTSKALFKGDNVDSKNNLVPKTEKFKLLDQNKGSMNLKKKKQAEEWRRETQLKISETRTRPLSAYQRYILPNQKRESKEAVKPRTAPDMISYTEASREPPVEKKTFKQKPETKDSIYATSTKQTNKDLMSVFETSNSIAKEREIEVEKNFDTEQFEKEKKKTIDLIKNHIFKTDSALDLDDLAIIDDKFLNGIDITGYVDEVFNVLD